MKLKKKKLNKDKVMFKKRCMPSPRSLKLKFGTHSIYFIKSCRLELIYLVMLRKILKRHKHYVKDKSVYHKRIWFYLRKNYIVSKKSKNARMGKGKGKFSRYAIRVSKNYNILEFYGWHISYIKNIRRNFCKKTNLTLGIYTDRLSKMRHTVKNKQYAIEIIRRYTIN